MGGPCSSDITFGLRLARVVMADAPRTVSTRPSNLLLQSVVTVKMYSSPASSHEAWREDVHRMGRG